MGADGLDGLLVTDDGGRSGVLLLLMHQNAFTHHYRPQLQLLQSSKPRNQFEVHQFLSGRTKG